MFEFIKHQQNGLAIGKSRLGRLFGVVGITVIVAIGCGSGDSGQGSKLKVRRDSMRDTTFVVNGVKFDMVFVESGSFTMGCVVGRDDWEGECPAGETLSHQVVLSGYYIGKYPVTQAQWRVVTGSNPSHFGDKDLYPVEMVSWDDVQQFIKALNVLTGREFRLPSEAEWEFAARGGIHSKGFKYSGDNDFGKVGWFHDNSGDKPLDGKQWDFNKLVANNNRTRPVGGKLPNELGIHDMSGNVWEWVNDWFGGYSEGLQTNPTGPSLGSYRVVRGGGWDFVARICRVSNRGYSSPDNRHYSLGFRLAVSP
jgi:formylglycine-generating enzyme required for sulfatase activity